MLLEREKKNRKEEDEEDITSGTHQRDQKKREKQMMPKTKNMIQRSRSGHQQLINNNYQPEVHELVD